MLEHVVCEWIAIGSRKSIEPIDFVISRMRYTMCMASYTPMYPLHKIGNFVLHTIVLRKDIHGHVVYNTCPCITFQKQTLCVGHTMPMCGCQKAHQGVQQRHAYVSSKKQKITILPLNQVQGRGRRKKKNKRPQQGRQGSQRLKKCQTM